MRAPDVRLRGAIGVHVLALVLCAAILWLPCDVNGLFLALHLGLQLSALGVFVVVFGTAFHRLRVVYLPVILLLVFVAVFHADNFASYGEVLTSTLDAVFQTSTAEALAYIGKYTSPRFPLLCGTCLAIVALSLWRPTVSGRGAGAGLCAVGCVLLFAGRQLPLMILETGLNYRARMHEFAESRADVLEAVGPVTTKFDGNVVLVIGESLSRAHFSVYGYPRETSPSLEGRRASLAVFTDIISSHSHTTLSLSRALTFNHRGRYREFEKLPDLISVARAAGLKTYWLSNQNASGVWDNVVAAIAAHADLVKFHDPHTGRSLRRTVFDDAMLESLDRVLDDPTRRGKLIVVHMMAGHSPYCRMVPPDYAERGLDYSSPAFDARYFGDWLTDLYAKHTRAEAQPYLDTFDCYDRAINYVDSVVGRVIDRVASSSRPSAVLFVSDHGEAPIFATGHDSRVHSHLHVEVPFILWRSGSYPIDLAIDEQRPGSLADLSHTVAALAGISGVDGTDGRSLLSKGYVQAPRTTLDGRIGYDTFDPAADYVERARANLQTLPAPERREVWADRINTLESSEEARAVFAGIEMGLVFDGRTFQVDQPPAPEVGLGLREQLDAGIGRTRYWFEWNDASRGEATAALRRLDAVAGPLKQRSLVEMTVLDGTPALFAADGWRVSYQLPTDRILACMQDCSAPAQQALADHLLKTLEANGYDGVSFSARVLPFVTARMSDGLEREEIPAFVRDPALDVSDVDAPEQMRSVLAHDWVRALLVTLPSPFRRGIEAHGEDRRGS